MIGLFSFGILIAAFVFQLSRRSKDARIYKTLFLFAVIAVFLFYLYLVYFQYLAWRDGGELTKFLLPPHQSIFYVFGYHFARFLIYYLISFAVAVLFLFSANHFNRRFGEKFFEPEEPYLGALSIFLLGNPAWNYAWTYYIGALLVVAVLITLYYLLITKENRRFSLYWLWLPVALSVIIVMNFVI